MFFYQFVSGRLTTKYVRFSLWMLCVVYVICGDEHWTALTELNKCYRELKVFVLRDIGLFPLIIPGGLRNHIDGWMLSYLLFVKFVYKNKCSCALGLCLPSHMYTSFSLLLSGIILELLYGYGVHVTLGLLVYVQEIWHLCGTCTSCSVSGSEYYTFVPILRRLDNK